VERPPAGDAIVPPVVEKLPGQVASLLATCRFGVLATSSDGGPHLSLVAIATADNGWTIAFATDRATRKFTNLRNNPRAAILIDNREELEAQLDPGVALTATGPAVEVREKDRFRLERVLLSRHPYLADLVSGETSALIALCVDEYRVVSGISDVRSIRPPGSETMTQERDE
jgi:uncharacterized pyridoxamine 5'-phosphate oxidase family protein